jgi:hypothetical protein
LSAATNEDFKNAIAASNREKRNYAVCDVVGDFPIINLNSSSRLKEAKTSEYQTDT